MSVWLREAAGWVLLGAGLAAFAVCYFAFLLAGRVIEAIVLGMVGFAVFRGGLHLLKVAMAARMAQTVKREMTPAQPKRIMLPGAAGPVPGRPRESGSADGEVMKIPSGVEAIFFDAVGTVLMPSRAAPRFYAEAAREFNIHLDPTIVESRFREAFRLEEVIDAEKEWQTSEARERGRWQRIVSYVFPDSPRELFDLLYAHYGQPEAWQVPSDCSDTFAELEKRGYRLGLGSNYDSRLRTVLAGRPELTRLCQRVIISSEVGVRKPSARFFQKIVNVADCPAERILFVGDDRQNDFEGAVAAKMHGVLLDASNRHPMVVERIARIGELVES